MSFGNRLRKVRESFRFTQQDVADKLTIPRSTYNGYESETNNREPDFKTLIKLSDIFNVSIDYLVRGKEMQASENNFVHTQIVKRLNEMEKEFTNISNTLKQREAEIKEIRQLL